MVIRHGGVNSKFIIHNMNIMTLGIAGGLFALLALVHFVVDWIFQTHSEAMVKHNNPRVRAKHCLIYTIGFIPLLYFFDYSWLQWLIALNILFWSHFAEDTYVPVFWWAKYIRKPSEMEEPPRGAGPHAGFVLFIQTTLGKILMIAVDQIIHLVFLIPLVYMALT